ncbi:MAG: hypothetical protein FWF06_02675 [Symbiobacteriaceae bacterium]|nr:hypothetical protein [Symbiobacteriaceae bacterium]
MLKLYATASLKASEKLRGGIIYLLPDIALRVISLVTLLYLWRTLFASGAGQEIDLSLSQMMSYTLLSEILYDLLVIATPASQWLYEGLFLSLYQRPLGVLSQLLALTIGGWIPNLLLFSLPLALSAPLWPIRILPVSWLFLPSLLLCMMVGFAIDLLFACLIIRMQRISWVVTVIRGAVVAIFSGALIPFAALPYGIGNWLQFSPFGALAGAPLAIAIGSPIPWQLILSQLLWCVILWPLLYLFYNASREEMMSYGG